MKFIEIKKNIEKEEQCELLLQSDMFTKPLGRQQHDPIQNLNKMKDVLKQKI